MTHCERLLEALKDGKPKTHTELYRLGIMVHSRVADLRRKGYRIAAWCVSEGGERVYVYQLTGLPERAEATRGASPSHAPARSESPVQGRPLPVATPEAHTLGERAGTGGTTFEQLEIGAAA